MRALSPGQSLIWDYGAPLHFDQIKYSHVPIAAELLELFEVQVLRFHNHVNSIAISKHHHHHNSNSETLQLSIIIIIPLRLLGHFPESIPEC